MRRRRHKRCRGASDRDVNGESKHRWVGWYHGGAGVSSNGSPSLRCVHHQTKEAVATSTCTGVRAAGRVDRSARQSLLSASVRCGCGSFGSMILLVWYTTSSTTSTTTSTYCTSTNHPAIDAVPQLCPRFTTRQHELYQSRITTIHMGKFRLGPCTRPCHRPVDRSPVRARESQRHTP
jgi:hypothetical protein